MSSRSDWFQNLRRNIYQQQVPYVSQWYVNCLSFLHTSRPISQPLFKRFLFLVRMHMESVIFHISLTVFVCLQWSVCLFSNVIKYDDEVIQFWRCGCDEIKSQWWGYRSVLLDTLHLLWNYSSQRNRLCWEQSAGERDIFSSQQQPAITIIWQITSLALSSLLPQMSQILKPDWKTTQFLI